MEEAITQTGRIEGIIHIKHKEVGGDKETKL